MTMIRNLYNWVNIEYINRLSSYCEGADISVNMEMKFLPAHYDKMLINSEIPEIAYTEVMLKFQATDSKGFYFEGVFEDVQSAYEALQTKYSSYKF